MPREWILDVEAGLDAVCTTRLKVRGGQGTEEADVVASCRSLEEFRQEIARMKAELDDVLESARQKIEALQYGGNSKAADPGKIWKEMEDLSSDDEMFKYFNGFSPSDRAIIAEYVLTQVNMFKGRGPVFSEHYDSSTNRLD